MLIPSVLRLSKSCMEHHLGMALVATLLLGCDSGESPSSPGITSGPIIRYSDNDPSMKCLVALQDGTSLELYRSTVIDGSADDIVITIRHRINLHHQTGESLNDEQQPLRSLSYSIARSEDGQPGWQLFPKPQEKGEMSFYMFYYRAVISTKDLNLPIDFKVETEKESYEVKGPKLSEFGIVPPEVSAH